MQIYDHLGVQGYLVYYAREETHLLTYLLQEKIVLKRSCTNATLAELAIATLLFQPMHL